MQRSRLSMSSSRDCANTQRHCQTRLRRRLLRVSTALYPPNLVRHLSDMGMRRAVEGEEEAECREGSGWEVGWQAGRFRAWVNRYVLPRRVFLHRLALIELLLF